MFPIAVTSSPVVPKSEPTIFPFTWGFIVSKNLTAEASGDLQPDGSWFYFFIYSSHVEGIGHHYISCTMDISYIDNSSHHGNFTHTDYNQLYLYRPLRNPVTRIVAENSSMIGLFLSHHRYMTYYRFTVNMTIDGKLALSKTIHT